MDNPVKIAPSILSADFAKLGEEVKAMCAAGCDYIHIDVMDGHFVPNITFGPNVVAAVKPHTTKPLDVHLMVAPVAPHIDAFAKAGADIITFHPEADTHPHRSVQAIKASGCKVGLSLNPATPIHAIEELMGEIDLILVMTVNPGFSGQKFISSQLDKITRLSQMIRARAKKIELEVDGGVTADNAAQIVKAGATILVAGTATFAGGIADYAKNIAALRTA